ncbi:MAG: hypothetical protein HXY38_10720 [Chloroflexi bacterium]|nr:hypothetical protein [Chloroflexota bacterium]
MNKQSNQPLRFALVLYWASCAILLLASMNNAKGHFGYPLDDTYIHMAMAKNFVVNGVWGASHAGFSSSTSSPLWTFLIAVGFLSIGVNDLVPFVLAFIAGNAVIVAGFGVLISRLGALRTGIALSALVILTPLAMLTLSGMEHVLHGLLTILLLFEAAKHLENAQTEKKHYARLLILAGLITITRYEAIFLISAICLLLLFKRRVIQSMMLGGAGALPISIYGLIAISKGWYFLPNSVLLKGNTSPEGLLTLFQRFFDNALVAPHIIILLLIGFGVFTFAKRKHVLNAQDTIAVFLFTIMTTLHMLFASTGWFYRYDAYLVLTGILIIARGIAPAQANIPQISPKNHLIKQTAMTLLIVILLLPFAIRAERAHSQYPIAVKNIHDQQYQMGRFIQKYYSGAAVAANDIGAIGYLAEVKTLDLFGLASLDVAEAKLDHSYNAEVMHQLAKENQVEIIIIYNSWFEGNIPGEWIEIGRWRITNNVVCADDEISFYVIDESYKTNAILHLQEFANTLPKDVAQTGAYTRR